MCILKSSPLYLTLFQPQMKRCCLFYERIGPGGSSAYYRQYLAKDLRMNNKSLYFALALLGLMSTTVPVLVAQEQNSTPSPSEQRAITILNEMSQFLAKTERFSVTIRDGYDAVQQSGQKIEFGELRKVTVDRPDHLRIEVERSDGEKSLVIFNGKELTVYTAKENVYATLSRQGTLDQVIKYALENLKMRLPLAMMLLSTLPRELDNLIVSADYVETTTITEVPCDHLAVRTNRGLDFQVWVAQGPEPLPRRILITYKDAPGQPQLTESLRLITATESSIDACLL